MIVTLNGYELSVESEITVLQLLAELGLSSRQVAVERNLEFISRGEFGNTRVAPGDRVEIVTLVGGARTCDSGLKADTHTVPF